jgi:hypothetical protein
VVCSFAIPIFASDTHVLSNHYKLHVFIPHLSEIQVGPDLKKPGAKKNRP